MRNVNTLPAPETQAHIPTLAKSNVAMVFDDAIMDRIERVAKIMASGRATIPKHLQGNVGDCFAVSLQAMNWGMNPFAVAQKTHLVGSTLGYEAQLVNAVITSLAPVTGRIEYVWFGTWEKILGKFVERESKTKKDDNGYPVKFRTPGWKLEDEEGLGVKVWATFKGEPSPRELTLLMTQARTRNSTLWADDPRQQLAYLAVKRWSRLYCPDVIMGVYTPDELDDDLTEINMGAAEVIDPAPPPATRTEAVKDRIGLGKGNGTNKGSPNLLGQVLKAIGTMTADRESRDTTKALAEKLTDPGEIEEASEAWRKRMEELKAEAAKQQASSNVDPETGEWTPSPEEMAAIHARELAEGGGK